MFSSARIFFVIGVAVLTANSPSAIAENSLLEKSVAAPVNSKSPSDITPLLEFGEFFKMPVGPYGLEVTDKLKSLDGKKVRLRGYMVKEDRCRGGHAHNPADNHKEVVKGRFMLSPAPVMVSYACFGTSDDLFPQTVFVRIPELADKPVPYLSTPMEVEGTLSVGPSEEPDDRVSQVRLILDPLPGDVVSKLKAAYEHPSHGPDHSACKHGANEH